MKIIHDDLLKQINFLDERFYTKDMVNFYPSVTHVLDVFPKGYGYIQWLKDLGSNAEVVMNRAGEQGTIVHDAISSLVRGDKLEWTPDGNYSFEIWRMLLRFMEFWNTYKPEMEANEITLMSDIVGVGGTTDFVGIINDERWLIDWKSGNMVHKSHFLQIATYVQLWNEEFPDKKIQRAGVLHLKASTRGIDRMGKKMQGEGWQLSEGDKSIAEYYQLFRHVLSLWKEENPNAKPKNMLYPSIISLRNN